MQRIYPVLLVTTLAVAVVLLLRPSLGEELIALAQSWALPATGSGQPTPPSGPSAVPAAGVAPGYCAGQPGPQSPAALEPLSMAWPESSEPGEAFATDTPPPKTSSDADRQPIGPYPSTDDYRPFPNPPLPPGEGQGVRRDAPEAQSYLEQERNVPRMAYNPAPAWAPPAPPTDRPMPFESGHAEPPWPPADYGQPHQDTSADGERGQPLAPEVRPPGPPPAAGNARPDGPQRPYPDTASRAVPAGANLDVEAPLVAQLTPCENAEILATVGTEAILAGELLGPVNELVEAYRGKIPDDVLEKQRRKLLEQYLQRRIQIKLVSQDLQRKIPAENLAKIEGRLDREYEEKEIPRQLKKTKLSSRRELEAKLESLGSSLEREKRSFVEQVLAQQWMRQQHPTEQDPFRESSPEEMLAYYHQHAQDFEHPARARWEQLTIKKSARRSDREAYRTLAELGNRMLDGADFAAVARESSEGPTAAQGGVRDWTVRGALVSQVLDEAIFTLPVGVLSPILEDEQGFHIVRVVERQDAYRTPFEEAQLDIREKLEERRNGQSVEKYLAKLREEIPVKTVFDVQPPEAQLSEQPGPPLR